jgi:hypothetical protein
MVITHEDLVVAVDRINAIGMWPQPVAAFLKRPAAMDFIEEYLHETGLPADEAVLTLLAAIRCIDYKGGYAADLPSVLEAPDGVVNLDLFLVRHHAELYHICRTRRIQANLPQRAWPVHEALRARYGAGRLAVIELGAAMGLIGRALCAPRFVLERGADYFDPVQRKPSALAEVAVYRGFDLDPPDADWILACCPFASERQRLERYIAEVPAGPDFTLARGLARDFPEYTGLIELEDHFRPGHADPLVPVVLTSFLLSRLPEAPRQRLADSVAIWTAARGGAWINLDRLPGPDGHYGLELDGKAVFTFPDEYCLSWTAI